MSHKSVSMNVHGYRIDLAAYGEKFVGDSDYLYFGDGEDVSVTWDGTDLHVAAAADDSVINIGDGTLSFDIVLYGSAAANYLKWDASENTLTQAATHFAIRTDTDTKNVRINSRDYTATSGDCTAVQIKPNMTGTGTAGVTGLESMPRFADAKAGSKLVGIMSNPILKGTTGNLSSAMRCYEGKLESDSGSTRTVAEAYVLHAMQALHGTVTTGPYVIAADAAGGNVAWAGFAKLPDDSQIANDEDTGAANTIAGYIKVLIGSATRYIYTYSVVPSG